MGGDAKVEVDASHSQQKKAAELAEQTAMAKSTDPKNGLSEAVAAERLVKYGYNELAEKKKHPFFVFLGYLWGPMPIMIWVAIIIEFSKGIAIKEGWEDFAVLMVLQFANAIVGFIEEQNAGDAIAALKAKLAPQTHVCRDGKWKSMEAKFLVPGDLIELKIGDVIPADSMLLDGKPVEVDQAALTGESLPVTKSPWEGLLMGSALKRGEAKAVVTSTGGNTFFGKAAGMINQVVTQGRLQSVLFKITMALLVLSLVLCAIILGKLLSTEIDPRALKEGDGNVDKNIQALSVVIVILVASIPIAIEVVCTSTLALGSHRLSAKGIIVARLSAIEELAGMTILCSDKTGTLTKNKLELLDPIVMTDGMNADDVVFFAALASKRAKGNQDAIDFAMTDDKSNGFRLQNALQARGFPLEAWEELSFEPFNPTDKRTLAVIRGPGGEEFQVAKGAPQVILKMSHNREQIAGEVKAHVQDLGERGYRSLGVAVNHAQAGEAEKWEYVGILSIFDPPRDDTRHTIEQAQANGIEVKMVTGDHAAIAKETCRMLGMGSNILTTDVLEDKSKPQATIDNIILHSHGFAEVMPEHKFQIVERIRQQGHVTGMTGDGVNDAPALKRADVGIAVAGATDAARAAADLVLTEEGLSVIIDAIFESRKIFQRMRNYIIYRIACTVQLLFFFFLTALTVDPDGPYFFAGNYPTDKEGKPVEGASLDVAHAQEFTLPVISMVIITILNDGCMITISHDEVQPENVPQRWAMAEMTIVAIVLGLVACLSSLLLLVFCMHANVLNRDTTFGILFGSAKDYITWYELRTIIYLKVSISDFLTLFSARTRTWFWRRPVGRLLGGAACIAMGTSTLLSLVWDQAFNNLPGAFMQGLRKSGGAVTNIWVYCVIWWFIQDACKVGAYHILDTYLHFDDPPPPLPNGPTMHATMAAAKGLKGASSNTPVVVANPLSAAHGGSGGSVSTEAAASSASVQSPVGEWATPRKPVQSGTGTNSLVDATNRVLAPVVQGPNQAMAPVRAGPVDSALSERRARALQMQSSTGGAAGAMGAAPYATATGPHGPSHLSIVSPQPMMGQPGSMGNLTPVAPLGMPPVTPFVPRQAQMMAAQGAGRAAPPMPEAVGFAPSAAGMQMSGAAPMMQGMMAIPGIPASMAPGGQMEAMQAMYLQMQAQAQALAAMQAQAQMPPPPPAQAFDAPQPEEHPHQQQQ